MTGFGSHASTNGVIRVHVIPSFWRQRAL